MGFVSDIFGGVTDMLTGGANKGPIGYSSPYVGESDTNVRSGIYGRLGAKKRLKSGATAGSTNPADYEYDMEGTTSPMTPEEAKKGYSGFGLMDTAMKKMGTYSPFTSEYESKYNPKAYQRSQFNFQGLGNKYFQDAGAAGSKNLLRANQGNLAKIQEAVGPRRPGLMLKSGEQSNRDVGEQLAALQTSLRGRQAEQGAEMSKAQQEAQAAENMGAAKFGEEQEQFKAGEGYKGYLSKAEKEKNIASERLARDSGFGDLANRYLGHEQTATEGERSYKDKALEWLMDYFKSGAGITGESQRAGQASADTRRGQTMGMLGRLFGGWR